jgi:hypothetical protein
MRYCHPFQTDIAVTFVLFSLFFELSRYILITIAFRPSELALSRAATGLRLLANRQSPLLTSPIRTSPGRQSNPHPPPLSM